MKKLLSVLVCMIMIVTVLSMKPTWSNGMREDDRSVLA